jgi:hypothetical protein
MLMSTRLHRRRETDDVAFPTRIVADASLESDDTERQHARRLRRRLVLLTLLIWIAIIVAARMLLN